MRNLEEIFRSDKEMSTDEKLKVITELSMMKAAGQTIDVMGIAVSVSPIGVDAHATGSNSMIERLGLEKEFGEFIKEVTPIAEKYSRIVSKKYRADFEKFVRGGYWVRQRAS